MQIRLQVTDNASAAARDLLGLLGPRGYKIAGVALQERIKEHLTQRDQVPHPRGWRKTHFHDRARQQTFLRVTSSEAVVAIALVGFATYVTGEPKVIRPVNARLLTVPARAEAYGRRAREFGDLVVRVVPNEQGRPQLALVQAEATEFKFGRKKKDGSRSILSKRSVGGEVYYWLAKAVRPKPHPEAIPTTAQMQEAIVRELNAAAATDA